MPKGPQGHPPVLTGEVDGTPKCRTWQTNHGWKWAIYGPYQTKATRIADISLPTQKEATDVADRLIISTWPVPDDRSDDA
jgi:hypothetical protein